MNTCCLSGPVDFYFFKEVYIPHVKMPPDLKHFACFAKASLSKATQLSSGKMVSFELNKHLLIG